MPILKRSSILGCHWPTLCAVGWRGGGARGLGVTGSGELRELVPQTKCGFTNSGLAEFLPWKPLPSRLEFRDLFHRESAPFALFYHHGRSIHPLLSGLGVRSLCLAQAAGNHLPVSGFGGVLKLPTSVCWLVVSSRHPPTPYPTSTSLVFS